tara:strand:+ start:1121 stop:1873 length:753 start_codon:yes stop_codon:yes gene_type:complete
MVEIDRVYQKVLALSNKEQRGYLTPQEFNLLASKVQIEIFENYFHDMKMAYQKPKNDSVYSDEMGMLLEKIQPFRAQSLANELDPPSMETVTSGPISAINLSLLPIPIYRLDTIVFKDAENGIESECVEVTKKDSLLMESNHLTKSTSHRPTFVREGNKRIKIYHSSPNTTVKLSFHYWRKPTTPKWGYVVVDKKALNNNFTTINFELHASEEENLVTRILQLAGVVIENPKLTQDAVVDRATTIKEQND